MKKSAYNIPRQILGPQRRRDLCTIRMSSSCRGSEQKRCPTACWTCCSTVTRIQMQSGCWSIAASNASSGKSIPSPSTSCWASSSSQSGTTAGPNLRSKTAWLESAARSDDKGCRKPEKPGRLAVRPRPRRADCQQRCQPAAEWILQG